MPVMKLAVSIRSSVAQALLDAIDSASGPCHLKFYTAAQPAGPATAVTTQTLLGTLTCSDPAGTIAAGVLTFGVISEDSSADANGTVTWARLLNGAGTAVADFDVSDELGTGVIKMNRTDITAGGPIQVTSFAITIDGA